MLRLVPVFVALSLLAPATATATTFGEVAFLPVAGAATCLRATGAPGELVRTTSSGAELVQVDPSGPRPVAALALARRDHTCAVAAARPGGAGIAAAIADKDDESRIATAIRDPGGSWGPVHFTATAARAADGLGVGVSDRGDAVVAYASTPQDVVHIQALRRAPGAALGPAEELFVRKGIPQSPSILAGMSATGDAIVAWTFATSKRGLRELWVAIAAPGAPFAAPVRVGQLRHRLPFSLAVGADGRMLLGFMTGTEVRVAERPPGGAFAAPTAVADAADPLGALVTVAVAADGGAIVAWRRFWTGRVEAVVRTGPGAFGAARTVARRTIDLGVSPLGAIAFRLFEGDAGSEFTSSGPGGERQAGFPRAVVLGGRALLTWSDVEAHNGVISSSPRSATIPLSGAASEVRTHGAELRLAGSVTPVELASGAAAVAWTDNHEGRDGRVHAALEGAADGADPPLPRLRVGAPSRRTLGVSQEFSLPVTCSAACDVRAQIGDAAGAGDEISLRRPGTASLHFEPVYRRLVGPRGGRVRVKLRYGAPGARRAAARTVTLRLRARPLPPIPRVIGAVARRDGDDVVVTWRTDRPRDPEAFLVFVTASTDTDAAALGVAEPTRRGLRLRVRIRNVGPARYATVFAGANGPGNWRLTRLRVRR
jgi:hypothetical protein